MGYTSCQDYSKGCIGNISSEFGCCHCNFTGGYYTENVDDCSECNISNENQSDFVSVNTK